MAEQSVEQMEAILQRMGALSPRPPHFATQARLIRAKIKAAKAAAGTKP